jgi:hypothetical protein
MNIVLSIATLIIAIIISIVFLGILWIVLNLIFDIWILRRVVKRHHSRKITIKKKED